MKKILTITIALLLGITLNAQKLKHDGGFVRHDGSTLVYVEDDGLSTPQGMATTDLLTETDHPIDMPDGWEVGDLLLVCFGTDGTPTISINTTVSGSNWTMESQVSSGSNISGCIAWKIAEGSDTLQFTTDAAESSTAKAYYISGAKTVDPIEYSSATGASTNADPPSGTTAYGNQDYLWLVFGCTEGNSNYTTAAPADFTGFDTYVTTVSGVSIGSAYREYDVDGAYDPGAFTSAIRYWFAFTIIINPN